MAVLNAQLTHFGIHAIDLDRMVDFYTRVMGFVISDTGKSSAGNEIFFMTQDPDCQDRKSTRLNSSHSQQSRMPSSA